MECLYKDVCTSNCSGSCIRYFEMMSLLEQSNIPPTKWKPIKLFPEDRDYKTFQTLAHLKNDIKQFVESGKNLYLFSKQTGNGKTSWSIKLMLKYFDEVWAGNGFKCRGLFIHTPTLLTKLKNFDTKDNEVENIKKLLPEIDLVIWDDIACSSLSNYDLSQLLTYIDGRILNGKSNIYTGNFGFDEMCKFLGSRLASRIWNTSTVYEFYGGDKR